MGKCNAYRYERGSEVPEGSVHNLRPFLRIHRQKISFRLIQAKAYIGVLFTPEDLHFIVFELGIKQS